MFLNLDVSTPMYVVANTVYFFFIFIYFYPKNERIF